MIKYRNKYCEITISEPDSAAERMEFYQDFRGAMALMSALQDNIGHIRDRSTDDDTQIYLQGDDRQSNRR